MTDPRRARRLRRPPVAAIGGLLAGFVLSATAVPSLQGSRYAQTTSAAVPGARTAQPGGPESSAAGDGTTSSANTLGASALPGARPTGGAASSPPNDSSSTGAAGLDGVTRSAAVVEGVTDKTIRIGIGLPDLGVVGALGPGYDDGDVRAQIEADLARLRAEGRIPIHGRDLEVHYREYETTSPEAQRAACLGWGEDDKVFAAVAIHSYWAAGDCVADEYQTPLIVTEFYEDEFLDAIPLLFTLPMSESSNHRNWVRWAVESGIVDQDSRIGLYYSELPLEARPVESALIPELERQGLADQVVSVVRTDQIATGSPQDNIAAQRFAANEVDVAWLVVGPINQTNFMQSAQSLLYFPTYVASDFLGITNDTAASTFPPRSYDGSLAFSSLRYGDAGAGIPHSPAAQACVDGYAAASGRTVDRSDRPAEWTALQDGCDLLEVLVSALDAAGPALSRQTFVAAMESYRGDLGIHPNLAFGPGRHGGTSTMRTLQWHADCTCWASISDYRPLPGP